MRALNDALDASPVDLEQLRALALRPGGFLTDDLRRRAWPRLLGVDIFAAACPGAGPQSQSAARSRSSCCGGAV